MNKKKFFYCFKYLILTIMFMFCFIKNTYTNDNFFDFWIIPFFYICMEFFSDLYLYDNSFFCYKVIKILAFLKYLCTFFLFYMENSNINYYNKGIIIIMFIAEIISVYMVLFYFYGRKKVVNNEKISKINFTENNTKIWGISALVGFAITILVIIKQPALLYSFFSINKGIQININGFEYLIYKTTFILTVIWLLKIISSHKNRTNGKLKIIISFFIILYFSLNIASSFKGNISRWTLLINLLILTIILISYNYQYKDFIKKILLISIIFFLPFTTFLKFNKYEQEDISFNNIFSNTIELANYNSFDAYFSGPYQLSVALKTKNEFRYVIDYTTLFNDIFNNFPLLNNYLNKDNTVPKYYNIMYHGTTKIYDKICPLMGQAYMYFGVFSPLLVVVIIYIACSADRKIYKSKNEIQFYMLSYISIFFSLSTCLNLTIIFQSLWLEILPLFLIYVTNLKLVNNEK